MLQQASFSRAAVAIRGISELAAGAPPSQSWPKRATDQPAGDREGTRWTARHYDEPADRKMDDLRSTAFPISRSDATGHPATQIAQIGAHQSIATSRDQPRHIGGYVRAFTMDHCHTK